MTYAVKEIFYTLQGEGFHSGRPAVFCRFAGCNLWSGREQDRAAAICQFCDTDFVGTDGQNGGRFSNATELAQAVQEQWPASGSGTRFVVLTGGEPLLQVDGDLLEALHTREFEVAVETNGTVAPPAGIDWLCVSPKAGSELIVRRGNELKLVFPQEHLTPEMLPTGLDFEHFFLQPMDGDELETNTRSTVSYCLRHPRWRLSLQSHKVLGID